MPFSGFPQTTLLEAGLLPLDELAERTRCEGHATRPIYRVHRWFARRLSTQFRSILAALTLEPHEADRFWDRYNGHIPLDDALVLDPFVGGGTTIVEASRCGAHVVGLDIDPVAAGITRFELGARARSSDWEAAKASVMPVAEAVRPYHQATLSDGTTVEVLHHFWVEVVDCQHCPHSFELHPHYLLAWDKKKGVQWAFCKHCTDLQTLPITQKRLHCDCGRRTRLRDGTLHRGKVACPQCKNTWRLAEGGAERPPRWRLFAQEVLVPAERGFDRVFKGVDAQDQAIYRAAQQRLEDLEAEGAAIAPQRPIPEAPRFDRRPLIHGIRRYGELFNARQRLHLTLLGRTIMAVEDADVRRLLGLAFSEHLTTNSMYTGYAFGYRRTSPLFSIHGFRHIVRPVEINPWLDGIGRGTFVNSLNKIGRAITYAKEPTDLELNGTGSPEPIGPADGRVSDDPNEVVRGRVRAAVAVRSSEDLADIPSGSVQLILTDPPYFDNISYSELSDFYLAWQQQLGVAEPPYHEETRSAPLADNLAATERTEEAVADYRDTLVAIFQECHRVLDEEGLCVFTYHHKYVQAWSAVGEALVRSGLRCTSVVPMRGEGGGGLHSKGGTIKWDAVLVCRKGETPSEGGEVVVEADSISASSERADWYGQRLVQKEAGFRQPDRQNFHLACLAAAATTGVPDERHTRLDEALQSVATHYEKTHA